MTPSTTLVVDQSMQVINIVPWQRAMSYLVRDRATLLEEYGSFVHAGMQMPAVVRLTNPVAKGRQKVKFSRANILVRDGGRCQYCGVRFPSGDLTFDHVVPRCQGGRTEWTNIVMACYADNQAKGNRTPAQADMRLLRQPVRPTWMPRFNARLKLTDVPREWEGYWWVELER